jgi:hypothetical protein
MKCSFIKDFKNIQWLYWKQISRRLRWASRSPIKLESKCLIIAKSIPPTLLHTIYDPSPTMLLQLPLQPNSIHNFQPSRTRQSETHYTLRMKGRSSNWVECSKCCDVTKSVLPNWRWLMWLNCCTSIQFAVLLVDPSHLLVTALHYFFYSRALDRRIHFRTLRISISPLVPKAHILLVVPAKISVSGLNPQLWRICYLEMVESFQWKPSLPLTTHTASSPGGGCPFNLNHVTLQAATGLLPIRYVSRSICTSF